MVWSLRTQRRTKVVPLKTQGNTPSGVRNASAANDLYCARHHFRNRPKRESRWLATLHGCRPQMIERGVHRDRLRIELHVQQRWTIGCERALERRFELGCFRDGFTQRAVRASELREIGIDEICPADTSRIRALLMHPDRPVHAVVDDDEDDRSAVLDCRRELLAVHHEATVAVPRDDD